MSGRSQTTFDEMVRMDLRYIREQSLWLDVKILCKTPLPFFEAMARINFLSTNMPGTGRVLGST